MNHPSDFFNTIPNPTTISLDEQVSILTVATEAMDDYIRTLRVPKYDENGKSMWYTSEWHIVEKGTTAGCHEPVDGTLVMQLTLLDLYGAEFIRFMQENVLKNCPTWRFEILGFSVLWNDSQIEQLAIYHDAVSTDGNASGPGKQDEFVRSWQKRNPDVFGRTWTGITLTC